MSLTLQQRKEIYLTFARTAFQNGLKILYSVKEDLEKPTFQKDYKTAMDIYEDDGLEIAAYVLNEMDHYQAARELEHLVSEQRYLNGFNDDHMDYDFSEYDNTLALMPISFYLHSALAWCGNADEELREEAKECLNETSGLRYDPELELAFRVHHFRISEENLEHILKQHRHNLIQTAIEKVRANLPKH